MANHGEREHAVWSASATTRNWNCAGALALGNTVEHLDIESEAAAWGTACHQVAEKCLRQRIRAEDLIGTTEKTKRHEFVVDEEMADTAQEYVDYVWGQANLYDLSLHESRLFIEQRFSLAELNPPFDAGGTCDAIIYNPDEKLLEVVDLKGGRGIVVEVHENKQLRTYALCAMLGHPELKVKRIKSTIVQPRAPHKDGRIRSETYHVADLLDWTAELLHRMHIAKVAEREMAAVKGDLMLEDWGEKYLKPGDHCTFCPAAGFCPKIKKAALDRAGAFFTDTGAVQLRNQPTDLDPERIAQVLDGADLIGNWLNAVRALATRLAETGTEIPGYQIVDKVGNRKWKPDVNKTVLAREGISPDISIEHKLRSPAQIEKAMGAKAMKTIREAFDALIDRPITGRTLVSAAKSTKPKVKPKAEAFFS